MKKVLMIANQFPPMGGSGVQRSVKFSKFLPEFGYHAVVLTKNEPRVRDSALMKDVRKDLEIIRVKGIDFTNKYSLFSIWNRLFGKNICVPDTEIFWAKKAVKAAKARLLKGDISAIYSTSFPYSDHIVGYELKQLFPHLPWVVDFRDEWTLNQYVIDAGYSAKRMAREKEMERKILRTADYVIANTDSMRRGFLSLLPELEGGESGSRILTIPNGFDNEDFEQGEDIPVGSEVFTVTHAGSMYGRRKPDLFLEAVSELVAERRIDSDRIRIEFIGNIKADRVHALAGELGIAGAVRTLGYMPHDELLRRLRTSAVLLLLEGAGEGSSNFSPGKVFEYIRLNRKILAVVPEFGEAANIIKQTNTGTVADSAKKDAIKDAVLQLYLAFSKGDILPNGIDEAIAKYERKNQAKRLAQVFDQLI